jgi:cytoskeletal protein CcmA (bactofilin family)
MGLFFSKKQDPPPPATELGSKTVFEGELVSKREINILGQVKGSVRSEVQVSISVSGRMEGTISSSTLLLEGTFSGTADISEVLFIGESANFQGELSAGKLKVAKGAFVQGKIKTK